jgi:predicted O-linked N-acetylglucosamine transferase (SPINDLY family)
VSPAKIQSLLQAALVHHRAGRLADADTVYRQVRLAAPKHFDALHLSGLIAYQQGRIAEAIELLGRAHRQDSRHVVCEMRLALALLAAKRAADAEKHLRHAVQAKPDFHEGWDNLAYCLKTQNRLPEAIECHQKSVTLAPAYAVGWYNYGLTLSLSGRVFEALTCHERALAADPSYAMARFGRAQALQQTHRIPEAVEEYGRFLAQQPEHHEARSYRLFALQYLDGVARDRLLEEHAAYGLSVGEAVVTSFPNDPSPTRRLRLAFLSPDLRSHSCAFFLEPLLAQLDSSQFEIFLYHDHFREDDVSARLRQRAAVWRNFVGQPNPAVEAAIRADAPDVLIDLAGHTGLNRLPLFARRLAPVQISYLGYPNTTGVAAMDYRFTDGVADPVGEADSYATERLVRFAPAAWAYRPPADAPEVGPAPFLLRGHVTFGCFNNLAKLTDSTLHVWSRILAAVPDARLHLKGRGLSVPQVRARYAERISRSGIDIARVELLERTDGAAEHLALYNGIDIALDTFPYHGTTTTCEALWMGVPVVTLAGNEHRSRVGASLLQAVGQGGWIATNPDDYVRIAAGLAGDHERLAEIRRALRDGLRGSVLLDHAGQAARFSAAVRECWTAWCTRTARRAA